MPHRDDARRLREIAARVAMALDDLPPVVWEGPGADAHRSELAHQRLVLVRAARALTAAAALIETVGPDH